MTSTCSSPLPPCPLLLGTHKVRTIRIRTRTRVRRGNYGCFRVLGCQKSKKPERAPPGVDTRIHWENPDEGWVGGGSSSSSSTSSGGSSEFNAEEEEKNLLGNKFSDLINDSADSHYQFLGVSAEADLEEIRAAYRRLSKEYHPDTTSLPIKTASANFLKLRQVYEVLSNEESRKFYNWSLAQEAASKQTEKLRMRLEDPYEKELRLYTSRPDLVDRLDGKNIKLSDQAMTALTFDIFVIIFTICCIAYYIIFKEQY